MIDYRLVKRLFEITQEEQTALEVSHIDRNLYMMGEENVVCKEKFLSYGKLIAIHRHLRFVDIPLHAHNYIELVYMVKGTTFHEINGREIALCEGELLLIGSGTSHSIRGCSINDLSVNFIIHPDFFKNLYFTDIDVPIEKFLMDSLAVSNASNYFHFKVADDLCVQNSVENLISDLFSGGRNKQTITRVTMEILFQYLSERTTELSDSSYTERIIMQVLQYIDNNYVNGTLTHIARQLNCPTSWLSREIKKMTGCNFKDLIQEKRLTQAVFLLKNTDRNIADIAAAVGYENTSFFYQIFTEKYGETPSNLRKNK